MASIFDRETYKEVFGHYPDGDYEVLDAVPGEDGVYRVPPLEEPVAQWKVEWRFMPGAFGIDYAAGKDKGILGIFHVTGL
jgi:hypothetical protein